jgi:hypothetical protein
MIEVLASIFDDLCIQRDCLKVLARPDSLTIEEATNAIRSFGRLCMQNLGTPKPWAQLMEKMKQRRMLSHSDIRHIMEHAPSEAEATDHRSHLYSFTQRVHCFEDPH